MIRNIRTLTVIGVPPTEVVGGEVRVPVVHSLLPPSKVVAEIILERMAVGAHCMRPEQLATNDNRAHVGAPLRTFDVFTRQMAMQRKPGYGLLRREALAALAGCGLIWHAGDVEGCCLFPYIEFRRAYLLLSLAGAEK